MKKLLSLFLPIIFIILAGCGGSTNADGDGSAPVAKIAGVITDVVNHEKQNYVEYKVIFTALELDKHIKVKLEKFEPIIKGCSVDRFSVEPTSFMLDTKGDNKTLFVSRVFYNCDGKALSGSNTISVKYNKYLVNKDGSKTRGPYTEILNEGDNQDVHYYELVTNPASATIQGSGQSQKIDVYVNDIAQQQPVEGTAVYAKVFNQRLGTLDQYSGITDATGRVSFIYTAPSTLPNEPLEIVFDTNATDPRPSSTTVINFGDESLVDGNVELLAVPKVHTIVTPKETRVLDLYLNDKDNMQPVAGATIYAEVFDQNLGTLDKYSAVTDERGHVVFEYTSPAKLPEERLRILFKVKGTNPIRKEGVFIDFGTTPIDASNYQLTSSSDTIRVANPNDTKTVDIYLSDTTTHQPVENQVIIAHVFDPKDGSLDKYSAVTNATGKATFAYTAPSTLPNEPFNITFELANSTPELKKDVKVIFGEEGIDGNLELIPAPKTYQISEGKQQRGLDLYLINKDTKEPVEGVKVSAKMFDPNLGTLDNYSGITDQRGHVVFNYIAPQELPNKSLNINFTVKGTDPLVTNSVTVDFGTSPVDSTNYLLTSDSNVVNVKEAGGSATINLYLSDKETHQPVENQTIIAYVFDQKDGVLNKYSEKTDNIGKASFEYTAPKDKLPSTPLNIKFELANSDPTLDKNITVTFGTDAGIYTYELIAGEDPYNIYENSKEYKITIYVSKTDENGKKTPAVNDKISAEFIQPALGSLSKYTVETDDSGKAVFTYISPKDISTLDTGTIEFYREINDKDRVKVNLKFDLQVEEGVKEVYLLPQTVQVSEEGAKTEIKVITVNSNNVGIATSLQLEQLTNGDGNDYGEFETTKITTNEDGVGKIVYTAPSVISDQPDRNITVTELNNNIKKTLSFEYISPTEGITLYELKVTVPDSIAVTKKDSISITIYKKGDESQIIDDENVKNVTVSVAKFADMILLPDASDKKTLTYDKAGKKAINIEAKTTSGIAIIKIDATIFNGKEDITISKEIPITIISGPIAAISLVYSGTAKSNGLFIDYYTVHAVDRYSNPVSAGFRIYPSLVAGAGAINMTDPYRVYGTDGHLRLVSGDTIFNDEKDPNKFDKVMTSDHLIILPSTGGVYKGNMGNWSIDEILSNDTLKLKEEYYAVESGKKLKYVIGSESRLLNGQISTAHVYADSGYENFETDKDGLVKLKIVYDPLFSGHTFALAANSYTQNTRSATALRGEFRSTSGYRSTPSPELIEIDGQTHNVTMHIIINDSGGEPLDNVKIIPSSIDFDSPLCSVDTDNSDLHADSGVITIAVKTKCNDTTNGCGTCTASWVNNNSGIYYEY